MFDEGRKFDEERRVLSVKLSPSMPIEEPASATPLELADDAAFDRHIAGSDAPVLVAFGARWCGPSVMMAGHYQRAAEYLAPRLRIVKADTEKLRRIVKRFAVRSIPTLILLKDGAEIDRQSGLFSAADIVSWVESKTALR